METPEETLEQLRARIDALDTNLSQLLVERIGIIREVAALKAEHWPRACHIRPGREGQMHQMIAQRFKDSGFPQLAALAIWRQLIGASTHLESPLNVVSLASHREHAWLAREYFGTQIGNDYAITVGAALGQVKAGDKNILVLPAPHLHEWWKNAAAIQAAGLAIFAAMPVTNAPMPAGSSPAVALAALVPEPSGDDISYHVVEGELITLDGFVKDAGTGIFLGAHPRPITLGA